MLRMKARASFKKRLGDGVIGVASDQDGSAAVEFAIVAPVFLTLMFATFEIGWFYFVNSQVDAASVEAARLIRTGQAQKLDLDAEEFKARVCARLAMLGNCDENLTVDVETFTSFAALAADSSPVICRDDSSTEIAAIPYEPGVEDDIVRLRLCFLYNTLNPALGINLADRANGKRRLYGTFLSRNEPFSRGSSI